VVVPDVEVEDTTEETLVLGTRVVEVFETTVVRVVVPAWSLSRRSSGTATPAPMMITAAAAIPTHRPTRLFFPGAPGAP
jgi:hypothetical protein